MDTQQLITRCVVVTGTKHSNFKLSGREGGIEGGKEEREREGGERELRREGIKEEREN